jgi:hypothetical protein
MTLLATVETVLGRPELINEHNTSQQSHGVPKTLGYHRVVELQVVVVGPSFRFLAAVRITQCHNGEGIWETPVNQEDS